MVRWVCKASPNFVQRDKSLWSLLMVFWAIQIQPAALRLRMKQCHFWKALSKNYRITEIGRDLWRLSVLSPLLNTDCSGLCPRGFFFPFSIFFNFFSENVFLWFFFFLTVQISIIQPTPSPPKKQTWGINITLWYPVLMWPSSDANGIMKIKRTC